MFCEVSDFENAEGNLVTRVEAIVEIGTGTSIRLEIYNIELYANDEIKIKSLYGR